MTTCIQCSEREAKPYGSAQYARRDLCLGCYYDYYQDKTRAEDALKDAARRAESSQAAPRAASAPPGGETPVWRKGANVAVREKPCDKCGLMITIRRAGNGKHYPADKGTTTPHWRACATARGMTS